MSTDPVPVPEAAVDAAKKAYAEAESAPNLVHCERCKGTGYHHGFGEDGHDPDWCRDCGGGGFALAAGEEDRPLRSALAAALPHLGWREDMENAPRDEDDFLVWFPESRRVGSGYWREHEERYVYFTFDAHNSVDDESPTRWQPLPPPPPSSKEDRT